MIKGVVQKITKNGPAYNIKVDEQWYGCGFNKPAFSEGSMIKFEAIQKGKWVNVDQESLEVLGDAPLPEKKKVVDYSSQVTSTTTRDEYWARKEERDIKNDLDRHVGATRNTAIAFVDLLVRNEALKLPASKDAKADALFQAVEYYASLFSGGSENSVNSVESSTEETENGDNYE